jgi:hypothetical protein
MSAPAGSGNTNGSGGQHVPLGQGMSSQAQGGQGGSGQQGGNVGPAGTLPVQAQTPYTGAPAPGGGGGLQQGNPFGGAPGQQQQQGQQQQSGSI